MALALFVPCVGMSTKAAYARPSEEGAPQAGTWPKLTASQSREATEHLAAAIRHATVSADADRTPFAAMRAWLKATYPNVFAALTVETFGDDALLLTWNGSDPQLAPWVLMAHMDVVPAPRPEAWAHPPFAGEVADGFVWGRGALDVKCGLVGIMEAVNQGVSQGWRPKRTMYLAFGADEEIGGHKGAALIVESLKTRGVLAGLVLDEGGYVVKGSVPGVDKPVALIGIAEKGQTILRLRSEVPHAGHASMPVTPSAIGQLARALERIEDHPMQSRLWGPTEAFLRDLAPHAASPVMRFVFGHPELTSRLILHKLDATPAGQAIVRTTGALTVVRAGVKENVLPSEAEAMVDFRIAPFNTVAEVRGHVEGLVKDFNVTVETYAQTASEPSPVSRMDGEGYALLTKTVAEAFPEAAVVPYTTIGATDARYFHRISDHVFRFVPVLLENEDLARIHGHDERISVEGFADAVVFYMQLLKR